jgi:dihydroneopterin aldolase
MDETAIAFQLPHARASATHDGAPLDRISVRDYVRDIDIGAFRSERGVTQRIRFNVVLEVVHTAAAATDDVDRVVSYDMITDAIEAALASERLNLLETLAERVASICLADPRSVRAFVRVEKLDRIPGALGVEIVRRRAGEAAPRLRPVAEAVAPSTIAVRPLVVHLPRTLAAGNANAWLAAVARTGRPAVVCLDAATPQPVAASAAQRMVGLLAIDQAAWALADRDPRFGVASARTELDWALREGRLSVWAPAHMIAAARGEGLPDASQPLALAAWLAVQLGAEAVVTVGDDAPAAVGALPVRGLPQDRPDQLAPLDQGGSDARIPTGL